MSDPVVQTYSDCGGKTQRTPQASHSAWMAHWSRRNVNAALQNHSHSNSSSRKRESSHDTKEYQSINKSETPSNISNPATEVKRIGTSFLGLANESFRMTSTTICNENLGFQSIPTNATGQDGGSSSALNSNQADCEFEPMRPQITQNFSDDVLAMPMHRSFVHLLPRALDSNSNLSREFHLVPEGSPPNAKGPAKTLTVFRDSSLAMSRPLAEDFTASTSRSQKREFGNKNNTSVLPSFMGRSASTVKEELKHTNLRLEKFDYERHSASVVCEEKIESHLKSERSTISCLQKNKMPHLWINPLTKRDCPPAIGGKHQQMTEDFPQFGLLQNQEKHSDDTELEVIHCSCNSHPKFLDTHQDIKTMRICTTVDSLVGLRGRHPRFSQTTHSLLITKNTDFNLLKGNNYFKNYRGLAEFNENALNDLYDISSPLWQSQRGVKLQSLSSFTSSEDKENDDDVNALRVAAEENNVEKVKVFGYSLDSKGKNIVHGTMSDFELNNESSADTDIMDLNDFEGKNWLSGVNASSSKKVIKLGSVTPEFSFGAAKSAGRGKLKTDLPDMNLEVPNLPDPEDMLDNGEPSMSRTQSLDMETVVVHAGCLSYSELDTYVGDSAKQDPSSRWVKRLKSNASDSLGLGTKSSNLMEDTPDKNNIFFSPKNHKAISEPTGYGHHGKELMLLDKLTASMGRNGSSSKDTLKKGVDLLLSHSWIRRWCPSRAATLQKKPEAVVVCEPQSSRLTLEDLKERQFPSIAAMALMGKAMRGFQPCELQKRGSFVVWNTRGA